MKKKIDFEKYPRLNFWRKLGYVLFCFGGLFFVLPAFGVLSSWFGPGRELPLGDLRGVAVDSTGNIYCGTQAYSAVQKYDPEGNFLTGFHFEASGGSFRFRLNEKDELEIAPARLSRYIRFSPEGQIIEQKKNVNYIYKEFGPGGDKECAGPDGSTYRIDALSFLFPRVIKVSASGQRSTVISVPLHKWLIMGPLPAWLFAGVGVLLAAFTNTAIYKKETIGGSIK